MNRKTWVSTLLIFSALAGCGPEPETSRRPTLVEVASTPTALPPTPTTVPSTSTPESTPTTFTLAGQLGGGANAIDLEGDIVYAGIGTRLVAVDVSAPTVPRFLGQGEGLPGLVVAVAVQDGTAYVGAAGGLYVYDVHDPSAPLRISAMIDLVEPDRVADTRVIQADELVYMFFRQAPPGGSRLVAVNVSDPSRPVLVQSLDLAVTAAVTTSEGVLYIADEGRLQMVDSASPGDTLGEIQLEFKRSSSYWRYFVTVVGDFAYVGVSRQPLQVWDVRHPARPARVAASLVELPPSELDLQTAEEALYVVDMSVADCNFTVRAIDISDPAGLRYQADSGQFNCITDIAAGGDFLVAATEGGFQVFDHSDPDRLPAIGSFVHPVGFDAVYNVALYQGLAYIVLGHGQDTRLAVLDRNRAAESVLMGEPLSLPLMEGSGVQRLFVRSDRLYVQPGFGSMLALDISQPANPRLIPYEDKNIGDWLTVPAPDGYLWYTRNGNNFDVVDVRDLGNPTILGTVSTWPEGLCDLSLGGRYLVAASCAGAEKVLYGLRDPVQPVEVGRLELPDQFGLYALEGNTFYYASTNPPTLIATDITDLAHPREVSRLDLPSNPSEMLITEDRMYLFMGERLWSVKLTGRVQPYLEASLPLRVGDLDVDGNLLYLATYDGGLVIVQVEE